MKKIFCQICCIFGVICVLILCLTFQIEKWKGDYSMNKKNFTLIEPNIWKHNTEQKYVVDIFLGRDSNGKQQRTSKTCYSLADARKTLTLAKADKIKGVAKTKCKVPTIYELMDDYRQVHVAVNTEKTTSYGYSVIENHLKAYFESTGKNTRVDKISATTIDQYYKYLRDIRSKRLPNGMGANTIRKHHHYLNQLFDYALKHSDVYGIHINPVKNATPPNKQKAVTPNLKPYNLVKISELLNALHKNNDLPLECAVLIALFAGTRRGETDYIKWSELDLEGGSITIKGCRTCADVEIIKDKPKGGEERETSMCSVLVKALKEYRNWQLHNKELLGKEYFDSDFVLVRADGKPYSPKWVSRKFKEFLEKYGFPHIRYHDLRHLNASILLKVLPVTEVSEHLGHSTPDTTARVYAHSLPSSKSEVADELDNMFLAV